MLANMTKLSGFIILDDFIEILCKLVLSDIWIYGDEPQSNLTAQGTQSNSEPAAGTTLYYCSLTERSSDFIAVCSIRGSSRRFGVDSQ